VDNLLGAQANPEHPGQVTVSQPSDALTAQSDATGALDTLFLGLGAVALLVGAIGVANIMVISVLERRPEIGMRRALGATRGQIRTQFLAEAILLSLTGGAAGTSPARPPPPPTPAATTRPSSSPRRLGRRPGRRCHHRRPGRAAARHPRRTPVTDTGTLDRLTGQLPAGQATRPTGVSAVGRTAIFTRRDGCRTLLVTISLSRSTAVSPCGCRRPSTAAANARATATRAGRPAMVTLSRAAAAPAIARHPAPSPYTWRFPDLSDVDRGSESRLR
jgi:hypothetical protein